MSAARWVSESCTTRRITGRVSQAAAQCASVERDGDRLLLTVAHHHDRHLIARSVIADRRDEPGRAGDRRVADLDDDVADLDPGVRGRAAAGHLDDEGPRATVGPIGRGDAEVALLAGLPLCNWARTRCTSADPMANPTLLAATSPSLVITAVLMPTTWPRALTSGPPELPDEIAASVWIRPSRASPLPIEHRPVGRRDDPAW